MLFLSLLFSSKEYFNSHIFFLLLSGKNFKIFLSTYQATQCILFRFLSIQDYQTQIMSRHFSSKLPPVMLLHKSEILSNFKLLEMICKYALE